MMSVLQKAFPKRRDELMTLLDIDPSWRMHAVSAGQRTRVQIMLHLLRPAAVVLMDEVTIGV